jgi:hypothetical protein
MATTLKLLGTGAYYEGNTITASVFFGGGVIGMVAGKALPLALIGPMTLHPFTQRGVTITLLGVLAVNTFACLFNLGEILTP